MAPNLTATLALRALDETGAGLASSTRRIDQWAARVRRAVASGVGGLRNVGAVAERTDRVVGRMQGMISTLAPLAGAMAAYEGARGIAGLVHETIRATSDLTHERVRDALAGITAEEQGEANKLSLELSQRYRVFSQTQTLHALRNMRSIVGTYEEAAKLLDPVLKLRMVTLAAHPERAAELDEDFDKLTKSQEIVGRTQNPAEFAKNMDLIGKAMNVFGDTLRPYDFFEFAQHARQAGQGFSDQFLLGVAPTLMQSMGGAQAGTAMSAFFQQFVGGHMTKPAAAMLQRYGLLDPKKIQYTKAGMISHIEPGALVEHELAKSNPYQWINQVLLPALRAHGVTTAEQFQDIGAVLASKQTTGQALAILATQQSRIEKDLALEAHALGLDQSLAEIRKHDVGLAWQGVSEQFRNLLANAGAPLSDPAAAGLNALSGGMAKLEQHFSALDKSTQSEISSAAAVATALGGLGVATKVLTLGLSGTAAAIGRFIPVLSMLSALPFVAKLAADAGAWAQNKFGNQQTISTVPGVGWVPGSDTGTVMPHYTVSDIAKRLGGAEVTGSADLNVNVQVEPSDSFVNRIVSALRNDIDVFRSAGSTGPGMPAAVPNP